MNNLGRRLLSSLLEGEDMRVLGAGYLKSGVLEVDEISSPASGKTSLAIVTAHETGNGNDVIGYKLGTGRVYSSIGTEHSDLEYLAYVDLSISTIELTSNTTFDCVNYLVLEVDS